MSQAPLPSWSAPPRHLRKRNGADAAMAIAAAGAADAVGAMVAAMDTMAVTATAVMSVPVAGGPRVVFGSAGTDNRRHTSDLKTKIRCVGFGAPDFLLGSASALARKKEPRETRRGSSHGRERFRKSGREDEPAARSPNASTTCIRADSSALGCSYLATIERNEQFVHRFPSSFRNPTTASRRGSRPPSSTLPRHARSSPESTTP